LARALKKTIYRAHNRVGRPAVRKMYRGIDSASRLLGRSITSVSQALIISILSLHITKFKSTTSWQNNASEQWNIMQRGNYGVRPQLLRFVVSQQTLRVLSYPSTNGRGNMSNRFNHPCLYSVELPIIIG
jgi:hypothetical protein